MSTKIRKLMVTSALPYANGSIHLGHLVEFIQTDIWARYHRLLGNECYYIWGSDTHGTPIMLQAEKRGITPETLIAQAREEQLQDFRAFGISFDHFSSTHNPDNQFFVEKIYAALQARGDIQKETIHQLFDPVKGIFLPDRFVKGECPRCGQPDQYGDSCEQCGATYAPTDLKNPRSVISGATPVEKASEHYFFQLAHYEEALKSWTRAGHLQPEVTNKLDEWFAAGLQPWDISRDQPYFGFKIPGTEDKYFYVWLDAPICYISSCYEFCQQKGLDFEAFWEEKSEVELYHFIGKDIVYFHALFWPALLMGAGYRTPTAIFAHGMLTVNGQKMSKSRGTFIKAVTYLQHLDPEYLRYYYAAKLSAQISDLDLNLADFRLRVNADLVGKVVNIASRCAAFIQKYFQQKLAEALSHPALYQTFVERGELIAQAYEKLEFARAVREIMLLADQANAFIDAEKPWQAIKDLTQAQAVHQVCTTGLNLFRILMIYLSPVLPFLTQKVENFLQEQFTWQGREKPLLGHPLQPFTPLLQRIEESTLEAILASSREDLQQT